MAGNITMSTVQSSGMKKIPQKNQPMKHENSLNGIDQPDSNKNSRTGDSNESDKNKHDNNYNNNWTPQNNSSLLNSNMGSDFSAFNSKKGDSILSDSQETNSNTIKRSPFKQTSSSSSDKTSSDEVPINKSIDKSVNENETTATGVSQELLLSFDPLVNKDNDNQKKNDKISSMFLSFRSLLFAYFISI